MPELVNELTLEDLKNQISLLRLDIKKMSFVLNELKNTPRPAAVLAAVPPVEIKIDEIIIGS